VRPVAILSTGPAIAVPVSIIGKVLGARIIFVETGSRIQSLSLTGRIMYRWAHLFFVQWPQLREKLPADDPRVIYAGRLI
jgi:UDP-N-acetylglucosamine:LPS N-acetylglucosamine transferase